MPQGNEHTGSDSAELHELLQQALILLGSKDYATLDLMPIPYLQIRLRLKYGVVQRILYLADEQNRLPSSVKADLQRGHRLPSEKLRPIFDCLEAQ